VSDAKYNYRSGKMQSEDDFDIKTFIGDNLGIKDNILYIQSISRDDEK
jgi:hypothetical protein